MAADVAAEFQPPVAHGPDRLAVPILYYHRVSAPPRGFARWSPARRERFLAYDVLPAAFEAQLDWLVARDYTTILPRDLAAAWDEGVPLPERGPDAPVLKGTVKTKGESWIEVGKKDGAVYARRSGDAALLKLDPAKADELVKAFSDL